MASVSKGANAPGERPRWTEAVVFEALRSVFPDGAYTLLPQVRNQTGFSRRIRTADAVAISNWPSRGVYLAGVEIKVDAGDWKRELADPRKSAEIQRYCRYWYVAAPAGVVPEAEVPETWGLIEATAKGEKRSARIVKRAPVLEAEPPSVELVASIARAMAEVSVPRAELDRRVADAVKNARETYERNESFQLRQIKESVATFEAVSGVSLRNPWDAGPIGEAVRFVLRSGVMRAEQNLVNLRKSAAAIVAEADKGLAVIEKHHGDKPRGSLADG